MKVDFFPFSDVSHLSKRDIIFQEQPEKFKDFLSFPFHMESFGSMIEQRRNFPIDRELLSATLKTQYQQSGVSNVPLESIELLKKDDTFTVVTAHQPSLLTGPLYFIYKIISVINLAEKLSRAYKETVLPVFIIGSEDHDFEEINHLSLFGKKIVWEDEQGGAVGRMTTSSLDPVLESVYDILGDSDNAQALKKLISSSFQNVETYNAAVFKMVHQLFSRFNLVILLTDNVQLKASFVPHIKKEIFERPSQSLIQKSQESLEVLGLKSQAHAREINFFYLQKGRRDRIALEEDRFQVLDTDLSFSRDELEKEIEAHPERFSPNVAMRPIYQESILPNLAYLGGGGEIAYWTERKTQFAAFNVSFPILIRRNSLLWIGKGETKQMTKYNIGMSELFDNDEEWVQRFVKDNAGAELNFEEEFKQFNSAFEMLAEKAKGVDPNLGKSVLGAQAKQFKSFEQLTSRLLRTEKDRLEIDVNKIRKLNGKLFPGGSLQERKDNFIPFYLKYGEEYLDI